jgi:hypothetical protein
MRSPRWAWEGYILAGSLNGLVGPGGAGKGTFMAWMIARLTRGELPGSLKGTPATVLVIGDEDAPDEIWTPRIVAAGGDERRVHVLEYDSGAPLSLVRDIGRLEEIIRELGAELVYFDQVLDHFSADDNSHVAKDVRLVLGPIKNLARRLEIAAVYTTHPNKLGGTRSTRDRVGGSGQFVDLPRSMLGLGWHHERDGWRAVARGKGNVGRVPPALAFTIEPGFARNPKTGEVIEVGMVGEIEEDRELLAEDILPHPPREKKEPKVDVVERVMREIGADGEWHTRREAEDACIREGTSAGTFANRFSRLEFIKTEKRGRDAWWRLT